MLRLSSPRGDLRTLRCIPSTDLTSPLRLPVSLSPRQLPRNPPPRQEVPTDPLTPAARSRRRCTSGRTREAPRTRTGPPVCTTNPRTEAGLPLGSRHAGGERSLERHPPLRRKTAPAKSKSLVGARRARTLLRTRTGTVPRLLPLNKLLLLLPPPLKWNKRRLRLLRRPPPPRSALTTRSDER
jgi:hypothetical protein